VVLDRPSRRWLLSPAPYIGALLAILVFSPVILWNIQHDWASFSFQGPQRWSKAPSFHVPKLILYMLALITPFGIAGFVSGLRREARGRLFALAFTLVPLSVFIISSIRNETKLNWTGPAWLAALPVIAASVIPGSVGRTASILQRMWKPAVLALMLFYGIALHYVVLGLPGLPATIRELGMSWSDLGRQVEDIENEVSMRTGKEPLIVGMDKYNLASLLAFYDPAGDGAGETTALNLFGRQGLMYDVWFPSRRQVGKSLVLVSHEARELESPAVMSWMGRLEPIREVHVQKEGTLVATYFVRVAHDYRGPGQGPKTRG